MLNLLLEAMFTKILLLELYRLRPVYHVVRYSLWLHCKAYYDYHICILVCFRCCSVRASWWGDSESVWDHHWASNCICSGHWAQPSSSPPKAAWGLTPIIFYMYSKSFIIKILLVIKIKSSHTWDKNYYIIQFVCTQFWWYGLPSNSLTNLLIQIAESRVTWISGFLL